MLHFNAKSKPSVSNEKDSETEIGHTWASLWHHLQSQRHRDTAEKEQHWVEGCHLPLQPDGERAKPDMSYWQHTISYPCTDLLLLFCQTQGLKVKCVI